MVTIKKDGTMELILMIFQNSLYLFIVVGVIIISLIGIIKKMNILLCLITIMAFIVSTFYIVNLLTRGY